MKSILKLLMAVVVTLSFTNCKAQSKNVKTETVKIYGNCEMCEKTIETAGSVKKIATVDWNKDTKMALISYDTLKTTQDEILKRIALAGYDSDKFLAPDAVYLKLPSCCKYERGAKTMVKTDSTKSHEHVSNTDTLKPITNQLKVVFDTYFSIKDALVKTDGNTASNKAKDLLLVIKNVRMESLTPEEHAVWMKIKDDLLFDAEHISETEEAAHQRGHFSSLSKNIYDLLKVSKQTEIVYYQNCPMFNDGRGANWLSKESPIKNPYYGSQMLTCGKTVETIK
jgi:hypothetical protein